jgi:hypothetical protein|tara:strand:- start:1020 stop:2075 length:1056 start_codon:yes stop_codon:yes gene_type:complete
MMKKELKFTKEQLEDLYLKQKLSLSQIGKKFNCHNTNMLYWLRKFNIKRRPAQTPNAVYIPKEILYDLYINKKQSSLQIAEKLGKVNDRTIRKKLKKFGIKTRSLSEAGTIKFKASFSEDLRDKAYLLGLRAGDFHVKWARKSIRVQTTTTHTAQVDLLKKSFEKYGEIRKYYSKNKARQDEWFIYTDLDKSFKFLLKKSEEIPQWILENIDNFYSFLTAYMDCEGCWRVAKSHKNSVRFFFNIGSNDKKIMKEIKEKLTSLGYYALIYLDKKKGDNTPYGFYNKDIYRVVINRKSDIIRLIKNLIPLSKHSEKVRKMKFIIKNKSKKWFEIEKDWNKLKEQIKRELLKNI